MKSFETPEQLAATVGEPVGTSEWVTVDQPMIDDFARVTGDQQWIHIDVERAKREAPSGKTIAHGYLTLSLIPRLVNSLYEVRRKARAINYGLDKVRFLSPVPAGSRIRLASVLKSCDGVEGGYRFGFEHTIELEGAARPAAVVVAIVAIYS